MKGKRFVSCVLSGALALGLPVSGLSYADEMPAAVENTAEDASGSQNDDVPTAQAPEMQVPQTDTEAPDFRLILSDQDAYHLTWDQNHFKETTKEGETTLLYKTGDEVILDMETEPGYQIDKVIFADTDDIVRDQIHAEVPFEWKDEDTLTFTMPGNDVWMHTEYHMLSSEAAGASSSPTDAQAAQVTAPVEETSSSETISAESGAQDNSASETSAMPDSSNQENGQQTQDAGQLDANTAPDETAGSPSAGENESFASVIEADGFPAQGSVMMLSEIELASDLTDLPEDKFEDVTYPKDTVQTTLAQNDVKLGTPGIYTVVYRAEEAATGKFWFLVRPVRIVENRKEPETQTENGTEYSSTSDDESGETESDDSDDPDSQNLPEVSTEPDTEAEIIPEDMTEAELSAMEGIRRQVWL